MDLSQKQQRLNLNQMLIDLLGSDHVYFQPPETIKMEYPCIVYQRDGFDTRYADDEPYAHKVRYQVTIIDRDPDSVIPLKVANLPLTRHNRSFVKDNLYHDIFTLYY